MERTMPTQAATSGRAKFIVGGLLIIAAIAYLIISSTRAGAEYFMTVDELVNGTIDAKDHAVRVSGAVLGDTIQYDAQTQTVRFTIAHVPGDNKEIDAQGGLAAVLHAAVIDSSRNRIQVVYNGVKPDLLRNEAQAIMTGRMGSDGFFHADELLLKCPTKYEDAVPDQTGG